MRVKEMLDSEKPRERLITVGPGLLSDEEIISIILRTGTKSENVKEIASLLLKDLEGISNFKNATINSLSKIKGIGKVKAIELLASIELGKRVFAKSNVDITCYNTPKKLFEYSKQFLLGESQENFMVICLDSKCKIISHKILFKGTINKSLVHPREVFKYAACASSAFIAIVHNHPSGDVTPSEEDINVTQKLMEIGKLIDIPVMEHLIISDTTYYSFYENIIHKNKVSE